MDSDKERRKRLAALPFSEKLKILEKLRERSRKIAASDLRKMASRQKGATEHGRWGKSMRPTSLKEAVDSVIGSES